MLHPPTPFSLSFFSMEAVTYTRIDYFLLDGKLLSGVHYAEYHHIIISDHQLAPQLLVRKLFCEYLETQIKLFFETNDNNDVSPICSGRLLKNKWEGVLSSQKKRHSSEQPHIEEHIQRLDTENAAQQSTYLHDKISSLKHQLDQIRSEKYWEHTYWQNRPFSNLGINHTNC